MDIDDKCIEEMAIALADRPTQRPDTLTDGPIFIEPVFRVPHGQSGVIVRHVGGMRRRNSDGGHKLIHNQHLRKKVG